MLRQPTNSDPGGRPPVDPTTNATLTADAHGLARDLAAARHAKDHFFAHSARSPLGHQARHAFKGLAYYRPSASYRIAGLRIEAPSRGEAPRFMIETSDHRLRTAHRLGRLRFVLDGRELRLTAYRIGDAESDTLFVPFKDLTSGRETYQAGRYLDVEPGKDGTYVLDFNYAYHPYCAYSDAYSCPLPPVENHLPVRIEAGERLAKAAGRR